MEESLSNKQVERRSEQAGMFHFMREMTSALVMALIAIVYVIQAFKIPTGSMENSLLVGDFLLGLKFIYGAPLVPFSQELGISKRLPAVTNPKAGDVIIFKYPGADKKDYIKRCVAGPGSTIQVSGTQVTVDGKVLQLPPRGKYIYNGKLDYPQITNFKPLRIPAKGDLIKPSDLEIREFLFLKHLVHQENPTKKITAQYQLYLNGVYSNNKSFPLYGDGPTVTLNELHENRLQGTSPRTGKKEYFNLNNFDSWIELDLFLNKTKSQFSGENPEFRYMLYIDGKPISEYKVKYDNYFMMGDNRDNSLDSRYWGYLNRNFVKAKAFILYFSLDSETPYWQLPLKIRWNRIGKLIRSWDGIHATPGIKW
jgi:signal peptidase I